MNSTTKKIVAGAIALALPLGATSLAPQASAQEKTNNSTNADEYLNIGGVEIPDQVVDAGKDLIGNAVGDISGGGDSGLLGDGSDSASDSTAPDVDTDTTDTGSDAESTPDTDTTPGSNTTPDSTPSSPVVSATQSSDKDQKDKDSVDEQKTVTVKVHASGDKEDVKFLLLSDGEEVDSATTDEKGDAELTYDAAEVEAQSLTIATEDKEVELFDAQCHADGGTNAKIANDIDKALEGNDNPTVGDIDEAISGAIDNNTDNTSDSTSKTSSNTSTKSSDKSTSTDNSTDQSSDKSTDKSSDKSTDKSSDKSTDKSEESTTPSNDKSDDSTTSSEPSSDKPAADENALVSDITNANELSLPLTNNALENSNLTEAEIYGLGDIVGDLTSNPAIQGLADSVMPGAGTALGLAGNLIGGLGGDDSDSAAGSDASTPSDDTEDTDTSTDTDTAENDAEAPAPAPTAAPAPVETTPTSANPAADKEEKELGERDLDVETDTDEFSFEVEGGSNVDCDVEVENGEDDEDSTTSSTSSKTSSSKTSTPQTQAPVQSAPIADQGHKVDTGLETLAGKISSIF